MDTTILKKFTDKNCTIYTVSGSTVSGTITEVTDSFIEVKNKKGKVTAVNCEFISTVQEA